MKNFFKIILIVFIISMAIFFIIVRFKHPELTETQLTIEYGYLIVLTLIAAIILKFKFLK